MPGTCVQTTLVFKLVCDDEDSLDTACIKWADIRNGGWKSLLDAKFVKKTEKLDWACLKTRLLITESHRRKVWSKENSWKTKNNVIGCIDARRWRECDWLRKAERKGAWQRNLASMRKNLPLGRKHQQHAIYQWCYFKWPWTNSHPVSRSGHSLTLNISQTATDTAIVTTEVTEVELETAPKLLNGTTFSDIEWPLNQISRSWYYY